MKYVRNSNDNREIAGGKFRRMWFDAHNRIIHRLTVVDEVSVALSHLTFALYIAVS